MVALRILVPPVRVRVLPGQRRKIANWLVSRLAIFIFQNLAKGVHKPPGKERYARLRDKPLFLAALPHLFCHSGRPLFLSLRAHAVISASLLSFSSHSVIPATERESSEVKEGVLWIPHQVWNGRTMTRESVCCHSGAPPGIRSPLRARRSPNDREKEKTALIGPGGRQPRAERGRGLCERSEFRSPRARRRRPSEKARYRAAVLLGSFFSPKRRMNKKPFMDSPSSGE